MKLFIWNYLGGLTRHYHDGGGLVIVAENLEKAKTMNSAIGDNPPDKVYDLSGNYEEVAYEFPDAGYC